MIGSRQGPRLETGPLLRPSAPNPCRRPGRSRSGRLPHLASGDPVPHYPLARFLFVTGIFWASLYVYVPVLAPMSFRLVYLR